MKFMLEIEMNSSVAMRTRVDIESALQDAARQFHRDGLPGDQRQQCWQMGSSIVSVPRTLHVFPMVTIREGSRYDIPDNPAWSLYQGAVNQLQCIDNAIAHCDHLLNRSFGRPLSDVRRHRTLQDRESLVTLKKGVESEMADAFDKSSLDNP